MSLDDFPFIVRLDAKQLDSVGCYLFVLEADRSAFACPAAPKVEKGEHVSYAQSVGIDLASPSRLSLCRWNLGFVPKDLIHGQAFLTASMQTSTVASPESGRSHSMRH